MPRYFFHTLARNRLVWDATGLELPEALSLEDPELTSALWSEAFDKQVWAGRTVVVTDEDGKMIFVVAL